MSSSESLEYDQQPDATFESEDISFVDIDPVSSAIMQRLRIKARLRIEWLRELWKKEDNDGNSRFVSHAEVDAILEGRDNPMDETLWIWQSSQFDAQKEELNRLEKIIYNEQSRFAILCRIFSITEEDADLLQMCYAFQLDPSFSRLYAYLHDNPARSYATIELAQRLFGYGYKSIYHTESPLRIWQLVHEFTVSHSEPMLLRIDPMVRDWLQGMNTLDKQLVEKSNLCEVFQALDNWPVEDSLKAIQHYINNKTCVRVIISGPEGCGRTSFAAILAAELDMTLLAIDSDVISSDQWEQTYRCAQRQAFLDRTALCWKGQHLHDVVWPQHIASFPLQFVVLSPEQIFVPRQELADYRIEMPALFHNERQELWKKYIPESLDWPEETFEKLVNQHQITVGDIAEVASKRVNTYEEVQACLRLQSHNRMGKLAQYVECPFTWDDLVLPDYVSVMLQDILFEATDRNVFWENNKIRRLFPQGRGLMGMFYGPPGTGKTMSAQVIAAELGTDLFRIDLASVVSKYVGETSKNLDKIFSRAQHMDVVLLFDEADALLGKRTEIKDAHDRFANTDTNFLLQALEDYRGIAILSTNKKGNIDEAFLRRIRFVIEFPMPDSLQRFVIWHQLLEEIAGEKVLTKSKIKSLANNIELSGAQIKFSILGAMFAARREQKTMTMVHLLRGINRELMKEGKVLSKNDIQRLNGI